MSRIGKLPVEIAKEVTVEIENQKVTVTGPKGTISFTFPIEVKINKLDGFLQVERLKDDRKSKAIHGLSRTILANMIKGVSQGWSKELELVGVGYKAIKQNDVLTLFVGYSHPVVVTPPDDVAIEIKDNKIFVSGVDKAKVGQVAADIRKIRPPEPYKGKGIRYLGEKVRRKIGKTAKAAGVGFAGK